MNPRFAPAWTRHFLNAEKEVAGGGKALTIPELTAKLKATEDAKAGLEKQLGDEKAEVAKLTGEKAALDQQLVAEKAETAKLTGEVATLKAADKSAHQRQTEIAAANGVQAVEKPTETAKTPEGDAALWEKYTAANSTEQARMRETQGDKLDKAAAAFDARGKK